MTGKIIQKLECVRLRFVFRVRLERDARIAQMRESDHPQPDTSLLSPSMPNMIECSML